MQTNSRKLVNPETGQVFNSCREADRFYNFKNGTAWRIASGTASDHGVNLNFVEDSNTMVPEYDADLVKWLYTTNSLAKQVICVETNQIFNSCAEADRKLGLKKGTCSRVLAGKATIESFTLKRHSYIPTVPKSSDPEEFKNIPEFPEYSISNFGRVVRNSTGYIKHSTRSVTRDGSIIYSVMLSKNSRPAFKSLRALYNSAFKGIPLPKGKTSKHKYSIKCISDNKSFDSYMECVRFYHFDYQRFRESLHASLTCKFEHGGLQFEILGGATNG